MGNFRTTIGALPDTPAANTSPLTGHERHKVLVEWNQTRREHPHSQCVHQLFEEQAERTPDAVAVVFEDRHLTYRELNQWANQLARHLQTLGVGPDVLVGICMERSLELMVAIFGVLKAGGAYVPLDPNYPPDRIAYMLEKTQARMLIQTGTLTPKFNAPPEIEVVQLDADWPAIASRSSANLPPLATARNLIYVIFTSGSTGQPKGAAICHGSFSNLLHWFVTDFSIKGADRVLLCSSISFDLTQKNLYAPLLSGGTLYVCPPGPYDTTLIARLINDHGITLINCTPSAFYPLEERAGERGFQSLATLRMVFLGGEPISIPRIRPWFSHRLCHAEIVNTYGPTECTDICGFYRLTRENLDQYKFVPLGRPINHDVQLIIVDDALQPCPPGTPGELCVGGAGVGAGYVNDPEMTMVKFVPNPFPDVSGEYVYRTGDRVRMLPDGNLEFLSRLDNQVKIRGFRIELGEVEFALNTHPDIQGVAVLAKEDKRGEQKLVAYFAAKKEPPPTVPALREFLKKKLPDYMVPAAFILVPSFPLTPNGKIDRKALPAPGPDNFSSGVDYVAPRTPDEQKLAALWSEVLGVPKIGIHDNFFLLGGDSLQAVKLMLGMEKITGHWLELSSFLLKPTVAGLCETIRTRMAQTGFDPVLVIRKRGTRPPLFCLHGHTGDIEDYFKLSEELGDDQPVFGIRSPALEDLSRLPQSIEDAAADIVRLIRKIQPQGAPALAGYSWGGLLAFEVARQLAKTEGIQCYTALIGTTAPMRPTNLAFRLMHFIRYFPPWLWHLLADQKHRVQRLKHWREMASGTKRNLAADRVPVEKLVSLPISRHMVGLIEKYHPQPVVDVTIDLFRELDSYQTHAHPLHAWETNHLPDGGWSRWVLNQPGIYWLPGDHWNIVKPPAVSALAQSIRATMDRHLKLAAPATAPNRSR